MMRRLFSVELRRMPRLKASGNSRDVTVRCFDSLNWTSLFIGHLTNHTSTNYTRESDLSVSQPGRKQSSSLQLQKNCVEEEEGEKIEDIIPDSERPEDLKIYSETAQIAKQLHLETSSPAENLVSAAKDSSETSAMSSFESSVKLISGEGACERKCIFCTEVFPDTIALYQHKRYNCSKNPEVLIHQATAALVSQNSLTGNLPYPNGVPFDLYNLGNTNGLLDSKTGSGCQNVSQASSQLERKKRTVYTDKQLETLRDCYLKQPNPTSDDIEKIASNIGLTKRNVQVWFQNKRARDKKNPGIYDFLDSSLDRMSMGGPSPTPSTGQDLSIKIPTSPAAQDTSNPLSGFSKVSTGLQSSGMKESPSPLKPDPDMLNSGSDALLPSAFYSYQWLSLLSFYQAIAASNLLTAGGVSNPNLVPSQLANLAMLASSTNSKADNLCSPPKKRSASSKSSPQDLSQKSFSVKSEPKESIKISESSEIEMTQEEEDTMPLDLSMRGSDVSQTSNLGATSGEDSLTNANEDSQSDTECSSESLVMDLSSTFLPLMSPNTPSTSDLESSNNSPSFSSSSIISNMVNSLTSLDTAAPTKLDPQLCKTIWNVFSLLLLAINEQCLLNSMTHPQHNSTLNFSVI